MPAPPGRSAPRLRPFYADDTYISLTMLRNTSALLTLLLLLPACTGDPYARSGIFFSPSKARLRISDIHDKSQEEKRSLHRERKQMKGMQVNLSNNLSQQYERQEEIDEITDTFHEKERQELLDKRDRLRRDIKILTDLGE